MFINDSMYIESIQIINNLIEDNCVVEEYKFILLFLFTNYFKK
jgi:hypothetical protein